MGYDVGYDVGMTWTDGAGRNKQVRTIGRWALGGMLIAAGTSHLTWARKAFQAQVPPWIPLGADFVVVSSGFVEVALGAALVGLPRHRRQVGVIVATFFVVIFPGNISQLVTHTDGFGLNTDARRAFRLLFQPVLVIWALWSTGVDRPWLSSQRSASQETSGHDRGQR